MRLKKYFNFYYIKLHLKPPVPEKVRNSPPLIKAGWLLRPGLSTGLLEQPYIKQIKGTFMVNSLKQNKQKHDFW